MSYTAVIRLEVDADTYGEAEHDLLDLVEQLMNSNRNSVIHAELDRIDYNVTDEDVRRANIERIREGRRPDGCTCAIEGAPCRVCSDLSKMRG